MEAANLNQIGLAVCHKVHNYTNSTHPPMYNLASPGTRSSDILKRVKISTHLSLLFPNLNFFYSMLCCFRRTHKIHETW